MQMKFYEGVSKIYQKLASYVKKPFASESPIYITIDPLRLPHYHLVPAQSKSLAIDRQLSPGDISEILNFGLDISEEKKVIRCNDDPTPRTLTGRMKSLKQ